ncbi:MAG: DUF5685 family protein [bacterium]|nr:DUF5685 family protein [bacterium]
MLGYVRAFKPDMRFYEYDIYKAVYCSLCRELGRQYGPFARLILNYDYTLLALMYMGLRDGCDGYEKKRCVANPFKKCNYCVNSSKHVAYAAAVSVALFEYKVRDNIIDKGFCGSVFFRFIHLFAKRWSAKAYTRFENLKSVIELYEKMQNIVEQEKSPSLDKAAEPTATALKVIFEGCRVADDETQRRILAQFGYCLGKWIYLVDVAEDFSDDIKKGNYNPLIYSLPEGEDLQQYAEKRIKPLLNVCEGECLRAYELLDMKKYKSIIDNILYKGLKNSRDKIFNLGEK